MQSRISKFGVGDGLVRSYQHYNIKHGKYTIDPDGYTFLLTRQKTLIHILKFQGYQQNKRMSVRKLKFDSSQFQKKSEGCFLACQQKNVEFWMQYIFSYYMQLLLRLPAPSGFHILDCIQYIKLCEQSRYISKFSTVCMMSHIICGTGINHKEFTIKYYNLRAKLFQKLKKLLFHFESSIKEVNEWNNNLLTLILLEGD